jgi:hypothetical protein
MGAQKSDPSCDDFRAMPSGFRLLIEASRRIAAGRDGCRLTLQEFASIFPGDGLEIFSTFRVFLQAMAQGGRRKLRFARPGTAGLLPDETLLLVLIAAAQSGDAALLDAHLCWLARPDRARVVSIATCAIAAALASHGQWLRPPAMRHGLAVVGNAAFEGAA